MMIDVAILTYEKLLTPDPHSFYVSQVLYEESLMLDYYKRNGIQAERINWADQRIDWSNIGCAIFRSTWDYQDKAAQFEQWLDHVNSKTRLINPYDVIHWNLDKRYLLELEREGIRIVPTLFVEPQSESHLEKFFAYFETDELVIKPAVSAGGIDTYRVQKPNNHKFEETFQNLLNVKTMMIQPFQQSILDQGELSLVVINGQFTHAARKRATSGEFRVQDDHGGYAMPYFANDMEKNFAEKVVKACPGDLSYARVDVVYTENNELSVMEVELFEPELFFRFNRDAAEKLAQSVLT